MNSQKSPSSSISVKPKIAAARCQEVQTCLGNRDVPEYDDLIVIGMAVRVAQHIRGLPLILYSNLRLVCHHFLGIPPYALQRVTDLLAEIEFVYLKTEGKTILSVLPDVPYYEGLYEGIGEYLSAEASFTEAEQLTLAIVDRLAAAPENIDKLRSGLGADNILFSRNIDIGKQGRFLNIRKHRGRNIVLNPNYFTENADIFADHVAATNSVSVAHLLEALRQYQGWPLSLTKSGARIGAISIQPEQISLLERLAQDGVIKPPTIETAHSGKNHFLFTPTPYATNLAPTKRDIYEKAMAIVAAVRQGQLLPAKYAIRSPGGVLYTLKTSLQLSRATTEFSQQYRNLVHLRVGQLVDVGNGYHEFRIIDTSENREALDMAYDLVESGEVTGYEVDEEARRALQADQKYIESLVASAQLREHESFDLSEEQREEIDTLFLQVIS